MAAGAVEKQPEISTEDQPVADLIRRAAPYNPRRKMTDTEMAALRRSLREFGVVQPIVCNHQTGHVVGGHQRIVAAQLEGLETLPVRWVDLDLAAEKQLNLALNRIGSEWDDALLREVLAGLEEEGADLSLTGFDDKELERLLGQHFSERAQAEARATLAERFGVPPFSVLDARQGYWKTRKQAWHSLGIDSLLGRDEDLLLAALSGRVPGYYHQKTAVELAEGRILSNAEFERDHLMMPDNLNTVGSSGTSIFDPVLAELVYRWFSPPGGRVIDPCAGGSVRGIVAGLLGRSYLGIDLRPEQVAANRRQAAGIFSASARQAERSTGNDPDALTPVESLEGVWLKRDDLFSVAGIRGGKARTCWRLAVQGDQEAVGLVTAGSRSSPQVNIVAAIGAKLGIPVRCHTPTGELSPEVAAAQAKGAEIVQHKAGYNNVIVKRARDDAKARGWTEIPFGMECEEAVRQTRRQVANLPAEIRRLVVPVGSGMTLAGILWGLADVGREDLQVLAVSVGASPAKRLDRWAPPGWRKRVKLVASDLDYDAPAPTTALGDVELDPIYEAKALPWLEPGDCLWVVGIRETRTDPRLSERVLPQWEVGDSTQLQGEPGSADLVFSCPPYHDLEQYSDDPADLSNMTYEDFLKAYGEIIRRSTALLAPDRFAVFVVSEIRGPDGNCRGFVSDTIRAFREAGLELVNDAVLITPMASAAIRAAGMFKAARRMVRCHQNVLVFCNGRARCATEACGPAEFALPPAEDDDGG